MSRFAPFAVAGCAAFFSCALACTMDSSVSIFLSVLALAAFLLLLLHQPFENRRIWLFLLLAASLSLTRFVLASHSITKAVSQYSSVCEAKGQIIEILPTDSGVRYTLSLQSQPPSGKGRTLRAYIWARSDMAAGELGETISGTISFYPQPESLWERASGYGGGIHLRGYLLNGDFSPSKTLLWETRSAMLRRTLSRTIANMVPGQSGALLCAVLFGDRRRLSDETAQILKRAGLSHILALSGLHLSMTVGMLTSIPAVSKRKGLRICLGIGGIAAYLFLAGAPVSMVRAGIMWLLIFLSQFLNRPYHNANALGMAVFVLVLANPFSAASLSLWYSAGATAAILWFSPKLFELEDRLIPRRTPGKKLIGALLAPVLVSLCAMTAVIPISWAAGNTVSLLSPLSGLAASFLLPPMLLLGLPLSVLGRFLPSGLSKILLSLPCMCLIGTADLLSALPFAVAPKGMSWLLPCFAGAFAITAICLRDGRKEALMSGLFWCLILFSASSVSYTVCTRNLTRIIIPAESNCVIVSRNHTHILIGELQNTSQVVKVLEDYRIRRLDFAILNNRPGGELETLAGQVRIDALAAPPGPESSEFLRYTGRFLPLEQMSVSCGENLLLESAPSDEGYVLSLQADGIKLLHILGDCAVMTLDVYPKHQIVMLPAARAEGIDSLPSDYNVVTGLTDPYNIYHAPRAAKMVSAQEEDVCFTVKDGAISLIG